jgi:OmcA/MtrC family decaheme c-type cytochrome
MALLHLGVTVLAATNLVVPSHTVNNISRKLHTQTPAKVYTKSETEHYLTAQQLAYVRPGLNVTINGVVIGADRKPVVDLTFSDDDGQPLDRSGVDTPGALSVSVILSWYDPAGRYYTDYFTRAETDPVSGRKENQASTASGTWEDVAIGHALFHFTGALPADYDATKTHTLGIYATRAINLTDPFVINKTYYANALFDFRPDGLPVTDTWAKATTATCNQCHDPLGAHGGSRREVKLCVLCHNPQTVDAETGNTVDFKVMIHKIHMGSSLPSVQAGHPYQIIGHNNAVVDFSNVEFPQPINNCAACHRSDAAQENVWYTYPSRAACGACHDDIDWTTGENHAATGPQPDDTQCANAHCHPPQGMLEYDSSIKGAHTVVYKSNQLHGLAMQILSVTNAAPGEKPVVMFQVTDKNGTSVDPRQFDTLRFILGGPTTDYATYASENALSTVTFDGDVATYTFQAAVPQSATGTWVVSADVEWATLVKRADDKPDITDFTESPLNPVFYVAVTDPQPMARRTVVDLAKCNVCHDRLALHGGQRLNTQECVVCHNPNTNDGSRRPASAAPAESVQFARLIHRIHTGENLTHDFTIYGFGGSVNNFNEVLFPGDTRDCLKCHATVASGQQTYELPLGEDLLPVPTPRDYYSPMQPTAAACLGCHDTKEAAVHAASNTAVFGEACSVCHGVDDEFGVSKEHAR